MAVIGGVQPASEPPFRNSVVSTEFDFILDSDPSALVSVRFVERGRREMPDKRSRGLFAEAYVFEAVYAEARDAGEDGPEDDTDDGGERRVVQIWANAAFGSREAALVSVEPLAAAIGQLPGVLRASLRRVILHEGDETAYAEERGGFFVIYAENMGTRIADHDLQETVFHESAHVALEAAHATDPAWFAAQAADGGFITAYARDNSVKEDIPESALFAFVVLNHPGRLPADVEALVREVMPNRLAYFEGIEGFVVSGEAEEPEPAPE